MQHIELFTCLWLVKAVILLPFLHRIDMGLVAKILGIWFALSIVAAAIFSFVVRTFPPQPVAVPVQRHPIR